MRASKIYPFSIPANGSVNLLVSGDFVKIKSSTGELSLTGDTFGTLQNMLAGQGVRDTNFGRITLTDETGSKNNGYLLVSDSTFIDDRITGIVEVVDGELQKSKSGIAFSAYGALGAVAGQIGYLEVWNPLGSGKRTIIQAISHSVSVANACYALQRTSALISAASHGVSKSSVGSESIALTGGGSIVTPPGTYLDLMLVQASTPLIKTYKQPFICEPGSGVVMHSNIVNAAMYASVEFTEENV